MTTPADLRAYYASKYLASDGGTLTEQTADAGGSATTIVDAALTQADDYWNGAVGFFEADTTTAALRGQYFHVKDFDAASDTLTLWRALPAAVAAGDTYRLVLGGNYRSSYEIPGLTAAALSNVTGVTIGQVAFENEAGTGSLVFTASGQTLTWTAPGDSGGAAVAVGAGGDFTLFSGDISKWIDVTVSAGSLPAGDETDSVLLTLPNGRLIPDCEGDETSAGKTRYYAVAFKNEHATDTLYSALAYLQKEVSTAADTTTAGTLVDGGNGDAVLECTSLTNWPSNGWVYNVTKDDFRYYYNKGGNSMWCQDPGTTIRGKTTDAWEAGDTIRLAPDVDIGLGSVGAGNQFEDPANETTAPTAVTFSCPITALSGVSLGDLDSGDVAVVWLREVIPAGARAKASALSQLKVQIDVTGD